MFVLWFVRLTLHEAHKRCEVRPAHEQPSQCTQQTSASFVHLRIAVTLRVHVVCMSSANF
eukprot:503441-Prorocentrum_lima.AAC.1